MQIIDAIHALFELTVLDANPEPKGFHPSKRLKICFWIKNMTDLFQLSDYMNRLLFRPAQNDNNLC